MVSPASKTGGRDATGAVVPGRFALSIGRTSLPEPAGFRWCALSDVARLESGHTPGRSHPEYWDGGIPWVGIRDATAHHGNVISDTNQHVSELGLLNSSARLLPAGTVCLSRTASVGYVVIMGVPMATSQDFVNWVCGPELSPSYLRYLLMAEQESVRRFSYGTTHQTMYYPDAKALQILAPTRRVQDAIAEVLGALDDKIAANVRLAELIEDLLEAEVQLRWLGDTREDSAINSISVLDLVEINPLVKRPLEAEPLYLDMKKLPETGSGISEWEYRKAQGGARFMQGDTLVARITPCLQNRKTGYVDFLEPGQVAVGSTEFIVLRTRPHIAKPVSYFLAVNPNFRDFAIRHMVGTSGRQRVSSSDLATYRLPEPDSEWLKDFGRRAEAQFAFLKSLRDENRTLAATRDALLPQLMSGKLRVKDAEKVLEGVL